MYTLVITLTVDRLPSPRQLARLQLAAVAAAEAEGLAVADLGRLHVAAVEQGEAEQEGKRENAEAA